MDSNGTPMYMPVAPANGFGGGFGGDGWWIILLLLFAGGGWGGMNGGMNNVYPWMNQADITTSGFQNQMLQSNLSGLQAAVTGGFGDIQTALCGGFAGVNANISNGFAQAEIGENARQMANMNQIFGLSNQLSQCCCDNRLATVQTQNVVQNEGAATRLAIQQQTQAILDKMCQNEIDVLKAKNIDLQNQVNMATLAASQTAQTAQILAALTTTTPAVA